MTRAPTRVKAATVKTVSPGSADDVHDFEAALFARGFKPSTVNNRHRGLQSFFKWLLAEDEIDVNPIAKVRAPELKEVRPLVIVTPEQWAKLLRSAKRQGVRQLARHGHPPPAPRHARSPLGAGRHGNR